MSRLCESPQRLRTLKRLIPSATKKLLIDTLHAFEELRWVVRIDKSAELKHVEYLLSEEWSDRLKAAVGKVMSLS